MLSRLCHFFFFKQKTAYEISVRDWSSDVCSSDLDATEWRPASGRGRIYTYSVMRRVPEPYVIAYVTLEEGPTMMTNIVDCDLDSVRIGQALRVVFKPSEGGPPVPMFAPAP